MKKHIILFIMIFLIAMSSIFAGTDNLTIKHYVDRFGDSTNDTYISQREKQSGTFSNSATTNSRMSWYIIISGSEVSFVIFEYDDNQLRGSSEFPDKYSIFVKDDKEQTHVFTGENRSDRISLKENHIQDFKKLLSISGQLKIVIRENTSYTASEYNLGILECGNYDDLLQEIMESSSIYVYIENNYSKLSNLDDVSVSVKIDDISGAWHEEFSIQKNELENTRYVTYHFKTPKAKIAEEREYVIRVETKKGNEILATEETEVILNVYETNKDIDLLLKEDTLRKEEPRLSISLLPGYSISLNTDSYFRLGASMSYQCFNVMKTNLDIRLDASLITAIPGVYPSFDVTLGLQASFSPISIGNIELCFLFGTSFGYGRLNGEIGKTYEPTLTFEGTCSEEGTNIFLIRMIAGIGFTFDDFSIGFDLFLDMPMYMIESNEYNFYTHSNQKTASLDIGFIFTPSLSLKYRF